MDEFKDKIENTVHSLLYILNRLGGQADFHKVFKIMYFADQIHLVKYGTSVSDDKYIAMQNGPVPSISYDIFKALRGEGLLIELKDRFTPYFSLIDSKTVKAHQMPDMGNISESEAKAMDESIQQNKTLSFAKLTAKSHDNAWQKATMNGEIDPLNIARAGGASREMIRYIMECQENLLAKFE